MSNVCPTKEEMKGALKKTLPKGGAYKREERKTPGH